MALPISESFAGAAADINGRTLDGQAGETWFLGIGSTGAQTDGAGRAYPNNPGTVSAHWTTATADATDYGAEGVIRVATATGQIGFMVALTSVTGGAGDTRFYVGRYNATTGNYEIVKYTTGSYAVLASAAGSIADGDTLRIERTVAGGNATLRLLKNGAVVVTYTDVAPATQFLQLGQFGVWGVGGDASAGYRWDNFLASANPAGPTTYTLTAPSPASGAVNVASGNFTVTPDAAYTGTITVTPGGGGLSSPIVLTFSNSAAPQTFTITPTAVGTVTLTPTNSGGLTNPAAVTYTATAPPSAAPNADFYELGAGLAGLMGTAGVTLYTINSDGSRALYRARTTAGIAEDPDVPGTYHVAFPDGFAGVALLDTGGSPPALVVPLKVGVASAAEVFAWPVGGGTFAEAMEVIAGVHGGQVVDSADHGVSTVSAFKDPTTIVLVTANTAVRRTITSTP